jgi:CubicO group peptidase (beta-lactamase class C family)
MRRRLGRRRVKRDLVHHWEEDRMTSIAIRAPMLCIALLCAAPAWCMAAPGQQQATEATEALPRASEAHAGLPTRTEIEKLLLAFDVPGLAIATLSNCRLEGVTGYGVADLETRAPIRAETAFEAASLSKPVFAYLVLQLVDEGMIGLDEPIASSFPYPRIADGEAYGRITPRMVLAHRTGLPNWVGDSDDPDRTDPIAFKARPGSVYAYSGEAYELLRAYVERVSGASLNQLFQDRLGAWMPHSSFTPPLPEGAEASRGYRSAKDP